MPRRFEVSFGMRARGAGAAARARARRRADALAGRSTASTSTRSARAGSSRTTSRGKRAHSAAEIERELRLQIPLYMLVLRDLLGIEPLGGALPAARRRAQARAACCAPSDARRRCPGSPRTTTSTRRRSGRGRAARRPRAAVAERIRAGDVRHDPRGGDCPTWCDLWPMCRVSEHERVPTLNDRAAGRHRGARASSSSRPAPARARRRCSSSASRARSASAASTSTRCSSSPTRERAAGELRTRIRARLARARPARPGARPRRRLDLDDPRLLPPPPARVPVRRRPRPALPRARRGQAAVLRVEAFDARAREFCAGERPPTAASSSPPTARAGCAGCSPSVYETLRSAGRDARARARRRARARASASTSCATRRELARGRPDATEPQRTRPRRAARRSWTASRRPDRLLDSRRFEARGERAAAYEEARRAVEQAALDEAAARDRDAAAGAARALRRRRTRQAKARESALDFEDLQLEARDLLRDDEPSPRARAAPLPRDHGRRVPGHEPAPVRARRPARGRRQRSSSSSATSSSRSTASATPTSRSSASGASRSRGVLPLTRNYRSRPEVLAAVNELFGVALRRRVPAARRRGRVPRPGVRPAGRAARHRQGELRDTRRALARAARRGTSRGACASSSTRARRRRARSSSSSPPAPTPSGTRRSCARAGCRRTARPARGYFGQQQVVDLLAYLRLLHNRYDDEALLDRARLAARRRLERRARPAPPGRAAAAALHRARARCPPGLAERDERLLRAFRQRYERLVAASPRLSLERLCERIVAEHDYDLAVLARWDGRRRYANLRKLARLARSYEELRGPDIEGFVRFVREQEAVGARELEAVAEEEGADAVRLLTIHAAKGLEFKVVIVADAGRDRPRAVVGRDPRAPRRPLRLPRRPPADRRSGAARSTTRRCARREQEAERGREAAPLLRRDDARDRPADRLRLDRPGDGARTRDADRLGARAARGRGARRARATSRSSSSAAARGCSFASTASARAETAAPEPRTAAEDGQLVLFDVARGRVAAAGRAGAPAARAAAGAAAPPRAPALVHGARARSSSCSYKYYAVRVAGMRRCASGPSARGPRAGCRDRDRRRRARAARARRPARPASRLDGAGGTRR